MKKIERLANGSLSGALIVFTIDLLLALFRGRYSIHPYSRFGWFTEQFGIIFTVGFLSVMWISLTSQSDSDSKRCWQVVVLAAIATVLVTIYLRYFWISTALIALFCLLYAMGLIRRCYQRRILSYYVAFSSFACGFILFLSIFLASYFGKGN